MTSFTVEWFNRLDQLGDTDMTLTITHDDGVIPQQRIEKSFRMDPNLVDDVFLQGIAEDEIERIIAEWEAVNGV